MAPDERFDRLYDRHRVALVAYCRRRVARDAVDDVIADVFLSAWRRIDQIPDGAELPWLYGVARNVIANHRCGDTRRSRLGLRLLSERPAPAVEVGSVGPGASTPVMTALAMLSDTDQELLRLRAWEELPSSSIAVALGIKASAVDMRLSRARRRLEDCLQRLSANDGVVGVRVAGEGWL